MTEPDVALTDYGLFVECAIFAWLIATRSAPAASLRRWVVLFFACTGLAALLGGTVHGFFANDRTGAGRVLWTMTLLALGGTALAGWAIGARLLSWRESLVIHAAAGVTVVYAFVVLFVSAAFWVAIAAYLPAAVFMFAGFMLAALRRRAGWARLGALGLALSFVAAAIQHFRIAVHPAYFNHNALYHAVQGIALALAFVACRGLLASGVPEAGPSGGQEGSAHVHTA